MPEASVLDSIQTHPAFYVLMGVVGALALLLVLVAIVLTVKAVRLAIAVGTLAIFLGLVVIGIGGAGSLLAQKQTDATLSAAGLNEKDRASIRSYGESISQYPLIAGLGGGSLPIAGGGLAVLLGLRRLRRRK
jgi:hypothetical protein